MRRPTMFLAVLAVLTALLFAACAAASAPNDGDNALRPVADEAAAPGTGSGDQEQPPAAAPDGQGRLIVRTGSLELEVSDVQNAYQQARQLALRLGGYIGDSEFATDKDGRTTATVVLRIPADRYEEALATLRPLATKVVLERSQESDVTSQVVDLDARIANLRASEGALVKLFDRAGKISEVLEVQRELSTVRGQIEQLTAERQLLAKQAAMATLTVTLSLAPEPIAKATRSWDPGAEVEAAIAQLIDVGQGIVQAAIWIVIVVLPVALFGGLLVAIGVLLARRFGLWPRRAAADVPPSGAIG